MSMVGSVRGDLDIVLAVQAERRACAQILWREAARHRSAAAEWAFEDTSSDEGEWHLSDAQMLERLAQEIEAR